MMNLYNRAPRAELFPVLYYRFDHGGVKFAKSVKHCIIYFFFKNLLSREGHSMY